VIAAVDEAHSRLWQQPIPTNEERAAQLRESERRAERDRLWDMLRTLGELFGWCLVGLLGIGMALHSDDRDTGMIYMYAGLAAGYAGMLASLHAAFVRARERGDL
jgi:hypothetical protein